MSEEKKTYDLSYFFPENVKQVDEVEVPISKRFVDKEGNIIPFIMKPITTERIDELEKLNTKRTFIKGRLQEKVDYGRFIAQVAVESTIYPDFKDEQLRKAYKTEDPVEVAKRVLNVGGEYSNWIAKASEINGFEDSIEELEEAVKNS